jgi:hypothetical protein
VGLPVSRFSGFEDLEWSIAVSASSTFLSLAVLAGM